MIKIGGKPDHGFDEPLGLLSDCHRRIEWFLGALLRVSRDERGRPLSAAGRQALEQALAYFRTAAPRHTADEEESLFPLLRACGRDAASVMSTVDRLEGDHRAVEAGHATVERLASRWLELGELPDDRTRELTETLETLQRTYEVHIRTEDREVFPAAAEILSEPQLEQVGRQMAERRGVKYRAPLGETADHPHPDAK